MNHTADSDPLTFSSLSYFKANGSAFPFLFDQLVNRIKYQLEVLVVFSFKLSDFGGQFFV